MFKLYFTESLVHSRPGNNDIVGTTEIIRINATVTCSGANSFPPPPPPHSSEGNGFTDLGLTTGIDKV